ncbi:recombinase family protein [Streptosporangium roseum]|uniref:recombinase family protein n=1 Tax=Streptosporangium roseum TaxID=2001 RepID=UPI003325E3C5
MSRINVGQRQEMEFPACSLVTRVSTTNQNPDHQIDALTRARVAIEDIHLDKISGSRSSRPQLDLLLKMLHVLLAE